MGASKEKNISVYQEIDEERDAMFGKADEYVEKSSNQKEIFCCPQRSRFKIEIQIDFE